MKKGKIKAALQKRDGVINETLIDQILNQITVKSELSTTDKAFRLNNITALLTRQRNEDGSINESLDPILLGLLSERGADLSEGAFPAISIRRAAQRKAKEEGLNRYVDRVTVDFEAQGQAETLDVTVSVDKKAPGVDEKTANQMEADYFEQAKTDFAGLSGRRPVQDYHGLVEVSPEQDVIINVIIKEYVPGINYFQLQNLLKKSFNMRFGSREAVRDVLGHAARALGKNVRW